MGHEEEHQDQLNSSHNSRNAEHESVVIWHAIEVAGQTNEISDHNSEYLSHTEGGVDVVVQTGWQNLPDEDRHPD